MTLADLLPFVNHLWQSTLFAAAIWLVVLMMRKNSAAVRHRLWLAASLKFLIPFSVLVSIGSRFQWRTIVLSESAGVLTAPDRLAVPPAAIAPQSQGAASAIVFVWIAGVAVNIVWWFIRWDQVRRSLREATPLNLGLPVQAIAVRERVEPGIFGIWNPVLLLPEGILDQLSPEQFQTVIVHELCHVRRRDNLTAATHLFIEALFWFHPLIWWIKARLIEEQERACDEEVIRLGANPQVYAESILKLCEIYLTSSPICVAGMTGSDLKKRIEDIMSNQVAQRLSLSSIALLTAALAGSLTGPVMYGAARPRIVVMQPEAPATPHPVEKQQLRTSPPEIAKTGSSPLLALGTVVASSTVTVRPRIDGQLISVGFKEGDVVQAGQVLASIDARPYQVELAQAEAQLARDRAQLADARSRQQTAEIVQFERVVSADEAAIENARLQSAYAEIRSPITGIAGLRLIDPGNMVRAADTTGIVVITQVQPIAVLFNIPEDNLSTVLTLLRKAATVPVEAWARDNSVRLATGVLTAADNQIDTTTGTLRLKAVFDNKDLALFPNQFVNMRLFITP
jgi:RND family efflux transporter MFP subunit